MAVIPLKAKIIASPTYERKLLYCIKAAETPTPKMLGKNEIRYNHHPQQPSGTNEKNEKNDVIAVVPVLLPTVLLFANLHPNFFP